MLELVLGGARSGKSAYAEQCAGMSGKPVSYIATATALDDEMRARIARHREDRPADWQTIEQPVRLGAAINQIQHQYVIVDCLTLWMSNLLTLTDNEYHEQIQSLFDSLDSTNDIIFVSNEVGMGIVPLGEQTRRFVDETGRLHQRLAARCQHVTQVIAGIPNRIK